MKTRIYSTPAVKGLMAQVIRPQCKENCHLLTMKSYLIIALALCGPIHGLFWDKTVFRLNPTMHIPQAPPEQIMIITDE